jgi:hypothetical protein
MFIVYYRNNLNAGKIIRPTPFVSINYSASRNKEKVTGGEYSITLNGILLANAGSPQSNDSPDSILSIGPNYENNPRGDYTRPNKQIINFSNRAHSIFLKQQAIRALFAHDGQRMEFSSIRNDEPMIHFYPSVESISFEEGTYVDLCRYTINLTAPMLFDNDENILDLSANLSSHIEDYADSWSIEIDDSFGKTPTSMDSADVLSIVPRVYRITRSASATGKTVYLEGERYEAWEQARKFVKTEILQEQEVGPPTNNIGQFPGVSGSNVFGSKFLDIPSSYGAFNHIRSENIDKTAGSYSLSDSWILSSETAIENYEMSTSKSQQSTVHSISINGTVKGLSPNTADQFANKNKYNSALAKFALISNNNSFDVNSSVYKRASKMIEGTSSINSFLNYIPASLSLTIDEFNGEIKYDVTYDTRPLNLFEFATSENVNITDTYPGDIYSLVPVLNRLTGPIFQYFGGRTEYQRSLNIDITVDRSKIHYNRLFPKESYIYSKPSMSPLFQTTLQNIVLACSPSFEPNIRKYFVNPLSESWDPNTGQYSLQISWVYELNV